MRNRLRRNSGWPPTLATRASTATNKANAGTLAPSDKKIQPGQPWSCPWLGCSRSGAALTMAVATGQRTTPLCVSVYGAAGPPARAMA
jgi:hypothetical protein